MFPIILICVIIFVIFLNSRKRQITKQEQEITEQFWARENKANATRRRSLDALPYITIPEELLIPPAQASEDVLAFYETLRQLSDKKIVNLNGKTNTDLKLAYGAANLAALTEYDENYNTLICTIAKLGKLLCEQSETKAAIDILLFGIRCGSDITDNYMLLVPLLKESNDSGALTEVYQKLATLPEDSRKRIKEKLS
ncbi:hypothetical protein ACTQ1U_09965 [Thermoguttaceae bacterium LCP21S3_D4]|jgi:hypothetical protein|nr:hypothetical protein [Lachnospiraceae bacterium]HCJ77183.1 hypothetical protein [Roseburia sp.]